ncbi:hypothetical protein [Planctomicrobium piriforme]|uniref:Chemotaxis protein CheC n=1 Tax=Planctomicrobium piriforme TaxID=1576369 RepID=A0A1I3CKA7_9PLAN|nr:hypothetical protein [Planctomicrobium piriforme]SFH74621.1 chemotaxis protein CheC [Planctomicrobium piriforme]
MPPEDDRLNPAQLIRLREAFACGAADASSALAVWVNVPALVSIEAVEQLTPAQAVDVLGDAETPICCCAMSIEGPLSGSLLLAFDDPCGWALADLVLGLPAGSSSSWNELERSAALESTNIIGTNYSNGLANYLATAAGEALEMIPAPPLFQRDFAQSILEFALMGQVAEQTSVLIAHARFEIQDRSLLWRLLFVPNADSLQRLGQLLSAN